MFKIQWSKLLLEEVYKLRNCTIVDLKFSTIIFIYWFSHCNNIQIPCTHQRAYCSQGIPVLVGVKSNAFFRQTFFLPSLFDQVSRWDSTWILSVQWRKKNQKYIGLRSQVDLEVLKVKGEHPPHVKPGAPGESRAIGPLSWPWIFPTESTLAAMLAMWSLQILKWLWNVCQEEQKNFWMENCSCGRTTHSEVPEHK